MLSKIVVATSAMNAVQSLDLDTTWELFKPWKWPQANVETSDVLEQKMKFQVYQARFGKQYSTQEEMNFRMELFNEVDKFIEEWNSKEGQTHVVGHNEFSDWTQDERSKLRGFSGDLRNVANTPAEPVTNVTDIPASVDWREKGAVNEVQNQGQCGSCWAFSAVGAMEGAHFVKTGELVKLSEQQCVDCDDQSKGCNGGLQASCFEYAELDSMVPETEYPYSGFADTCFVPYDGKIKVQSYTNVPKNSVSALKEAIAKQPVAVTVDAAAYPFMHYIKGIVTDKTCGTSLDHAVIAVGYGTENGTDYYIVRNSWGDHWGESGYIRIAAVDGEGICGIQKMSLYPETN